MHEAHVTNDWFVGAIQFEGGVHACLDEIIRQERHRLRFVEALQIALCSDCGSSSDSITELIKRIKEFENTLIFRLGMLSPERKGAWFRESMKAEHGPFATRVLALPVFMPFEASECATLKDAVVRSYKSQSLTAMPVSQKGETLWNTLLKLNERLGQIDKLVVENSVLEVTKIYNALPPALESVALSAFLAKVQMALFTAREGLDGCYRALYKASLGFWDAFTISAKRDEKAASGATSRTRRSASAEDLRRRLHERRQALSRSVRKSTLDVTALKYMSFSDFPARGELRHRYLELARKLHPDGGGDEEAFKELNRYYSHLSNRIQSLKSERDHDHL